MLNLQEELTVRQTLAEALNHLRVPKLPEADQLKADRLIDLKLSLALQLFESHDPKYFFAELTDTFGGEANYCWVHRYKIRAKSYRGAAIKLKRAVVYDLRLAYDTGEGRRYNARGAAVCCFLDHWDKDRHSGFDKLMEL